MALSDHHTPPCLYILVTTSPYLLQPLTWMQHVLLTWLNDVTTKNITIWMTTFPMVCFLQTVKQLRDNPLPRCKRSCSSGPHQHCMILKHRVNITFTDTLPCFQIVFYLALTKKTDLKEIKPKRCLWTHHTHIRTTKTLSYQLHAKAALPPWKDSLIPKE